jgi:hypothetical protein
MEIFQVTIPFITGISRDLSVGEEQTYNIQFLNLFPYLRWVGWLWRKYLSSFFLVQIFWRIVLLLILMNCISDGENTPREMRWLGSSISNRIVPKVLPVALDAGRQIVAHVASSRVGMVAVLLLPPKPPLLLLLLLLLSLLLPLQLLRL